MHDEIDLADVPRLTHDDGLCVWAAQGAARAWSDGSAVAVAGPGLSRRDRVALYGRPERLAPIVRTVLDEVGPTYRPLGSPDVVRGLADTVPGLGVVGEFAWMERAGGEPVLGAGADGDGVQWLGDADMPEVSALIDLAFADSYARPGVPGVERWAGVRAEDGRLAAVAADAWSAPEVAFLSGVAVHPDMRGRGLGRTVCEFMVAAMLAGHGRVGLMVDDWNAPAERLYRKLGFSYRPLAASAVSAM